MRLDRAAAILVVLLFVATAAAFAYTERLKLQPGPIYAPRVDELLSPSCGCDTSSARVGFSLRRGGTISVAIVDAGGETVRTLAARRHYDRGPVRLVWDGRGDDGRIVPDGTYRPRLRLPRRTPIEMPNDIVVDTRAPAVRITRTSRPVISPDGDGRFDGLTLRYTQDEPAQTTVLVDGRRAAVTQATRSGGTYRWFGRLGARRLPAGAYRLSLSAVDAAGNVSAPTPPVRVRIRFVELSHDAFVTRAGARFRVRVRTDARRVAWSLAGRRGRTRGGVLALRAPARAGRYTLRVTANGHADRARVVVRPRG